MNNANEYVAYYLERLRQGQAEDAWFSLIEGGPALLPTLIEAFAQDENRGIRAQIVECIWQQRQPETVPFLAGLLSDPEPDVWRAALDGMVAIGGADAIRALEETRSKPAAGASGWAITTEWLEEALEQVRTGE